MANKEKKLRVKQPKPKQASLPTMEDRRIPDLHSAAERYVEGRDERMAQTKLEVELKTKLIAKMHEHQKTTYLCDDIEIKLMPEGETVKVKRRKDDPVE
jgi:hypothetical protein